MIAGCLGLRNRKTDDSRQDAKHAKDKQSYKFETRNPKFETNSKQEIQNKFNVPNRRDRIQRFGFPHFEFILALVCFGFRASNFGFFSLGAWRDKTS